MEDRTRAALEFRRCAPREREQQDSLGIDPGTCEQRDAPGERVRLAGACAGDDQQRFAGERCGALDPVLGREALLRVELVVDVDYFSSSRPSLLPSQRVVGA